MTDTPKPIAGGADLFAMLKARVEARKAGERPSVSLSQLVESVSREARAEKKKSDDAKRELFDDLRLTVDPWVWYQVVYFMSRYECDCCGHRWEAPSHPEPFIKEIHYKDPTAFRYRPLRGFAYSIYKSLPRMVLMQPWAKVYACIQCFPHNNLYAGSAEKLAEEQAEFKMGFEDLNHETPNEPGTALLAAKGSYGGGDDA